MLVPTGLADRPHPESPLPVDIHPAGSGDALAFAAQIDLTPSWKQDYHRWVRSWESPAPDTLLIRDEYELARGSGIDFYWNTRLPVEIGANAVTITGRRGRVEIAIPTGCTASSGKAAHRRRRLPAPHRFPPPIPRGLPRSARAASARHIEATLVVAFISA